MACQRHSHHSTGPLSNKFSGTWQAHWSHQFRCACRPCTPRFRRAKHWSSPKFATCAHEKARLARGPNPRAHGARPRTGRCRAPRRWPVVRSKECAGRELGNQNWCREHAPAPRVGAGSGGARGTQLLGGRRPVLVSTCRSIRGAVEPRLVRERVIPYGNPHAGHGRFARRDAGSRTPVS